jgi:hypothetical protein
VSRQYESGCRIAFVRLTQAKAINCGPSGICAHLWVPAGVTGKVLKDDGADSLPVELSLTYCTG